MLSPQSAEAEPDALVLPRIRLFIKACATGSHKEPKEKKKKTAPWRKSNTNDWWNSQFLQAVWSGPPADRRWFTPGFTKSPTVYLIPHCGTGGLSAIRGCQSLFARKLTLLDIPGLRQWKCRRLRVHACCVRMLRTRECQHAAECGNICVMWGQTEKHRLDTVDWDWECEAFGLVSVAGIRQLRAMGGMYTYNLYNLMLCLC